MNSYLYSAPTHAFVLDANSGLLSAELADTFLDRNGFKPSPAEVQSWEVSLKELAQVLEDASLGNTHVFLEYGMPLSSARCDVMIAGVGADSQPSAVVVELKQWTAVDQSDLSEHVSVTDRDLVHPSVQARSYVQYLQHYHRAFTELGVSISGCAFLHNMTDPLSLGLLRFPQLFGTVVDDYPLFASGDVEEFKGYLRSQVGQGDGSQTAQMITAGGIRPSTKLLDFLNETIQHRFEWRLLEEQLTVFDTVVSRVEKARRSQDRHVVVVRGGPGTGKSVLAIQLLAYAARKHWRIAHATGTKAFNTVLKGHTEAYAADYLMKAYGVRYKNQLPVKEMFSTFAQVAKIGADRQESLDLVVADEAHRLWDFRKVTHNGFTTQLSDTPMVEELVRASRVIAFFLDDNQSVRANEIGSVEYILEHARRLGVHAEVIDLATQFRCGGSQEYLDWVDGALGYGSQRPASFTTLAKYDFRIFDSMVEMQREMDRLKAVGSSCRFVAGFCWRWSQPPKNGSLVHDVQVGSWSAPWIEKTEQRASPLNHRYYKWAVDDSYYSQVGSIYSVQGFEFDYIGVIFGNDLLYRSGNWLNDLSVNQDHQLKRELKVTGENPTDKLRNVYRVLLSRGMKGTFVCFLDRETRQHFERLLRDHQTTVV